MGKPSTEAAPGHPGKHRHDELLAVLLPPLPRSRDDDDEDEDKDEGAVDGNEPDETGTTDRVPVIPWSDEDGDADSWDAGDLPWGGHRDEDDDPDDPDPQDNDPRDNDSRDHDSRNDNPRDNDPRNDDPRDDDPDDGEWDDLGWAGRSTEADTVPVDDVRLPPAMSSWQRQKREPVSRPTTAPPRSGGVDLPPEELEELWARRRAEADSHREAMRLLREGRRPERADDRKKDDDEGEKEIVPKSAELLQQADSVWGVGDDESGVIG